MNTKKVRGAESAGKGGGRCAGAPTGQHPHAGPAALTDLRLLPVSLCSRRNCQRSRACPRQRWIRWSVSGQGAPASTQQHRLNGALAHRVHAAAARGCCAARRSRPSTHQPLLPHRLAHKLCQHPPRPCSSPPPCRGCPQAVPAVWLPVCQGARSAAPSNHRCGGITGAAEGRRRWRRRRPPTPQAAVCRRCAGVALLAASPLGWWCRCLLRRSSLSFLCAFFPTRKCPCLQAQVPLQARALARCPCLQ